MNTLLALAFISTMLMTAAFFLLCAIDAWKNPHKWGG
jgi:hypothetical protein